MKEAFPNYYDKFICIADRCKHNCCIGWEIDIDEKTMELYSHLKGSLADKIRANITGDVPHFCLKEDDRCPFLNSAGLCDIITEYGESALCDICTMHPRFCNFYTDFKETGLGLCCEEAARIIISQKEKFDIRIPDEVEILGDEELFIKKRESVFKILQDRSMTMLQRFSQLAQSYGIRFDFDIRELCNFFLRLERLDEEWTEDIAKLRSHRPDKSVFENEYLQLPLEQLASYFVFRHLTDSRWDDDYSARICFVLVNCYIVSALWHMNGQYDVNTLADFARKFSAEIEYSQENTDKLMDLARNFVY